MALTVSQDLSLGSKFFFTSWHWPWSLTYSTFEKLSYNLRMISGRAYIFHRSFIFHMCIPCVLCYNIAFLFVPLTSWSWKFGHKGAWVFHKYVLFFSAFGFHLEESLFSFNQKCIENSDPNTNIHKPPSYCPPGTFYPYSRGYQKISGDTCKYGEDYRYDPLMYSCPVAGKSRLLMCGFVNLNNV